jgi:inosose dehydratase
MIHIGNAPCSWGTIEGMGTSPIGYAQMLDELVAAGYTGTELGDWGFMPTDPASLKHELSRRALTMTGAYVPIAFARAETHAEGATRAVKTARLLAAVADPACPPFIVLADDAGSVPARLQHAGRIAPEHMLDDAGWKTFAAGVHAAAAAVKAETGLRSVFHPHCAAYVETPAEIDRFLAETDPALVSIVFDTGHYAYGTGLADPSAAIISALNRYAARIAYMHFKDCSPSVAVQARAAGWDFTAAIQHGVFCELGQGCAPYPAVCDWLRSTGYTGFVTVEQDVLPGMGAPRESAARSRAYLKSLGI